jgi:drug/metabolite transporter (DMT)-like permease
METSKNNWKLKVFLAFGAIYLVWGSTYLAILYAIETIPPWSLSAIRFIVASLVIFVVAMAKREARLTTHENKIAAMSGVLLVLANGIVCVLEKWVPSGIAAVVIGAMPIWIMLVGWIGFGTGRPQGRKIVGACIGLVGIALIAAGASHPRVEGAFGPFAPLVLCVSSLLWATGTMIQRRATAVKSGFLFLAVQMASGALAATLLALVFESPWNHPWASVTSTSWLGRNVEPHLVSSYALVNPVIAVWLGWLLVDEPLTGKFVTATILVLIGLTILMVPARRTSSL